VLDVSSGQLRCARDQHSACCKDIYVSLKANSHKQDVSSFTEDATLSDAVLEKSDMYTLIGDVKFGAC